MKVLRGESGEVRVVCDYEETPEIDAGGNSKGKWVWLAIISGCLLFWVIIVFILCKEVCAAEIPKGRFVNAVIGEAESEGYRGMLAVACAIRNRGTLNGVYGEHAPRVRKHLYSPKIFVLAVRAYEESAYPVNCQFIDGADHWEGTKFPVPAWARMMKTTAVVGNQRFYRDYRQEEQQEMIDRRHGL